MTLHKMNSAAVRKKFLDFFKSKKHRIVASDSLVPRDDPTVLFTPAGMNQFKKEFMGFDSGFKRAASCQRCLRTDDLDKVGKTSGHHTFFEMLGNFSFGDYFKKEAIAWAWEFLTETLGLPEERLWVSVYKEDDEAYGIWRDTIGIPQKKIVRLGDKENFWPSQAIQKGPNGPCGPCSEIFYDQGDSAGCGKSECSPACSCGRFLEVWNLVFTQYNRLDNGKIQPLPNKNIDTGMGFERLCAVMQGVHSNFESDLFLPLVKHIVSQSSPPIGEEAKKGSVVREGNEPVYAAADHIRAIVFSIYDGVLPSNEARGYVVRKLIRKSVLHLRSLGINKPFLYTLVPLVAQVMEPAYPDLKQRQENIAELILVEEKNFIATLDTSSKLLREHYRGLVTKPDPREAGRIAFRLYDTYGLPLELTRSWLKEKGVAFSSEAFNSELHKQRERSKSKSAMKGDVFSKSDFDYGAKATKFLGYTSISSKGKILSLVIPGSGENRAVKKITQGSQAVIILDQTPFYAEGGGQVADTGSIQRGKNNFRVDHTTKVGRVYLHHGKVTSGGFKVNDAVTSCINHERRLSIARNHTATHMLQAALRKVLGAHVKQQGSLVDEDKLRFDFTHFKSITPEQLARVEEAVNTAILNNIPLKARQMTLAQARTSGALAFFQEKYDEKVRVVSIGGFSLELCGGTHLESTGQIGLFKILQESSIASGVRRIEAATGAHAYAVVKRHERALSELSALLNTTTDNLSAEVDKRLKQLKLLQKELHQQRIEEVKGSLDDICASAEEINGIKVITKVFDKTDMDLLRRNADGLKSKAKRAVIALGSVMDKDRALLVVAVTPDLVQEGLSAAALIKEAALAINGSGGGRDDFAQAGGTKPAQFPQAFERLKGVISSR